MKTTEPNLAPILERNMPIIIGVWMVIVGLGCQVTASLATAAAVPTPTWLPDLLTNLGVGLLTAGIIMATLESISRRRMQDDIARVREAHVESILQTLMPQRILEEVKEHVIRQPFVRTDFNTTVELHWTDATKQFLVGTSTTSYVVENASQVPARYELCVGEEKLHEDRFPGRTRIGLVELRMQGAPTTDTYEGARLKEFTVETSQDVEARIPVDCAPGLRMSIVIRTERIFHCRAIYPTLANKPTIGLDIYVDHPEDLLVQAIPLHPSEGSFRTVVTGPALKHWKIDAGLLPFQGMLVNWHPTAPTAGGE